MYLKLFVIREKGIKIINLELKCGYAIANIDERMFHKKHMIPDTVSLNTGDSITDTSAIKQTSKSKSILPLLKKQMLAFPDKVSAPKIDSDLSIHLCEKMLFFLVYEYYFSHVSTVNTSLTSFEGHLDKSIHIHNLLNSWYRIS